MIPRKAYPLLEVRLVIFSGSASGVMAFELSGDYALALPLDVRRAPWRTPGTVLARGAYVHNAIGRLRPHLRIVTGGGL